MLNTIDEGIKAVRQGKIVIVVDDENRENEGDFIVSGEKITPDIVNFMITHGRGLLCVPLPRSRCEELQLYPMSEDNTSLLGTPFTMSVDLKGYGCTTGVSAYDRSATIRALVTGNIKPSELARPGHIFPQNSPFLYTVDNEAPPSQIPGNRLHDHNGHGFPPHIVCSPS